MIFYSTFHFNNEFNDKLRCDRHVLGRPVSGLDPYCWGGGGGGCWDRFCANTSSGTHISHTRRRQVRMQMETRGECVWYEPQVRGKYVVMGGRGLGLTLSLTAFFLHFISLPQVVFNLIIQVAYNLGRGKRPASFQGSRVYRFSDAILSPCAVGCSNLEIFLKIQTLPCIFV